jgi:hypothetical protein
LVKLAACIRRRRIKGGVVASILGLPISGDRFWSRDIFDAT